MLKELLENGTNRKLSQSKGHRNKHCVSPLEQFNHSNWNYVIRYTLYIKTRPFSVSQ